MKKYFLILIALCAMSGIEASDAAASFLKDPRILVGLGVAGTAVIGGGVYWARHRAAGEGSKTVVHADKLRKAQLAVAEASRNEEFRRLQEQVEGLADLVSKMQEAQSGVAKEKSLTEAQVRDIVGAEISSVGFVTKDALADMASAKHLGEIDGQVAELSGAVSGLRDALAGYAKSEEVVELGERLTALEQAAKKEGATGGEGRDGDA